MSQPRNGRLSDFIRDCESVLRTENLIHTPTTSTEVVTVPGTGHSYLAGNRDRFRIHSSNTQQLI
ncbi:MAG TPA: hypothetical protein DIW81_03335 [Planctomycetaceae bacterium]|nr:hypothetical protein [Planctomycetaceae bacterium]